MKKILLTTAAAAVAISLVTSCTTHEYPPTRETVVVTPAPAVKRPAKVVVRDTPENTTVVRPEE